MSKNKESNIPSNVLSFYIKCSRAIARFEEESFCDSLGEEHYQAESPIENILSAAIRTIARVNCIYEAVPVLMNDEWQLSGLQIDSQHEIGPYRVDFLVTRYLPHSKEFGKMQVIVECDSQQFHERTEKERRYEKRRDRFLIRNGYKVLHYTGKEIIDSPFDVAAEIISFVLPTQKNIKEELIGTINEYLGFCQ